ncbi:phage recombination protein Bet [Gallibacterium anatis]|uniref:Recombinase n=1 Tax=Gallibacterium anatis TaxID=750 RepID=A0A0A2XUQ3_9PAST|nr:phage recombination protein Bet [Gallibacterium anatis]KGQ34130.1 recombinase [Gallibacterium anatis]
MATTALQSLTQKLADRFEISDGSDLMQTLKNTAFRGDVNDSQMTALLIVANQYGLNPWTKEIYAFPDRNNGIVPIVGVDGWARILNENPQFDGIEFDLDEEKCTCRIYRKDRSRPISVTEYMSECYRDMPGPWRTHPKRMLRHKAMIQCARLAFGFTGIYDQDEAERIVEEKEPINVTPKSNVIDAKAVELITDEQKKNVEQLLEIKEVNLKKALAYYNVDSINKLSKTAATDFINRLNLKDDKVKNNEEIPL